MNLLRPLIRLSAGLFALFAFTSCIETYPGAYYDGGGSSYYGGSSGYIDDGYYPSPTVYRSRPVYSSYGGYGGYGYGSRYAVCPTCHHSPCTCSHNRYSSSSRDRDSRSSSSRSSSDDKIRLVKYREGEKGRDLPDGYHSKEWYKARGYSLKQNTYETKDGDKRGHSGSSSSKKKK